MRRFTKADGQGGRCLLTSHVGDASRLNTTAAVGFSVKRRLSYCKGSTQRRPGGVAGRREPKSEVSMSSSGHFADGRGRLNLGRDRLFGGGLSSLVRRRRPPVALALQKLQSDRDGNGENSKHFIGKWRDNFDIQSLTFNVSPIVGWGIIRASNNWQMPLLGIGSSTILL